MDQTQNQLMTPEEAYKTLTQDLSSWELCAEKPDIVVKRKYTDDSPVATIFYKFTYDIPINRLYLMLSQADLIEKWYENAQSVELVEQETEDQFVIHYVFKTPPGFSNRDMTVRFKSLKDYKEFGWFMIGAGITHVEKPEQKGIVRGSNDYTVNGLKDLGNGKTEYTCVTRFDLNGMIPKFVMNYLSTKTPMAMKDVLLKTYKKLDAEDGFEDYE